MRTFAVLILRLVLGAAAAAAAAATAAVGNVPLQCVEQLSSCSCRLSDGRLIDLSPIQGSPGPAFSHDSTDGYTYLYNPCLAYKCGNEEDGAWCQEKMVIIMQYVDFGTQSSAKFDNNPATGNLRLRYLSRDNSKTAFVNLVCDPLATEASVTTDGAQGRTQLTADLRSRSACPVDFPGGGMSGGDILLLVAFSLLAAYLLAGLAINYFVRKQSGRDILPNVAFWISLPGLVADGSAFVYEKCRDLVLRRREGYGEVK